MSGLGTLATLGLELALQSEAYRRRRRELAREKRERRRELLARLAEEERKAREKLLERLAATRARAGAAGVATGSSFDAVLRGLERRSEAEMEADRARLAQRLEAVDDLYRRRARRDLLARSERWLSRAEGLVRGLVRRRSLLG